MNEDKSKGLRTDFSDAGAAERVRRRLGGTTNVSLATPDKRPGAAAITAAAARADRQALLKGDDDVKALRNSSQGGEFSQE